MKDRVPEQQPIHVPILMASWSSILCSRYVIVIWLSTAALCEEVMALATKPAIKQGSREAYDTQTQKGIQSGTHNLLST